jgi:hypothetical protein
MALVSSESQKKVRLFLLKADSSGDRPICAIGLHHVTSIPFLIEVTFYDSLGMTKSVLYADSYCPVCGQHFFITENPAV